MTARLRLVAPNSEKRTVAVRRLPNDSSRAREHLPPQEVKRLIDAARTNKDGPRDGLMILLAYQHGLRASELVGLDWSQLDLKSHVLHVRRAKDGTNGTHPLSGEALRGLR